MVGARQARKASHAVPLGRSRRPTSLEHLPDRSAPPHAAPSATPPAKAILYSEVSRLKM